jgi:iron complex transport system ATP-binding protein
VAELVLMGRTPHLGLLGFEGARDLELARAALERMGIASLADRPVLGLSGGERQLAVVARALVQEPRLFLLDEPTAFLDLRHRLHVLDVVRERVATGASALVVSHDLGVAARCCDRLALLAGGRVLASGTPREVLRPDLLRTAYGIDATIVSGPDDLPLVVPNARPSG